MSTASSSKQLRIQSSVLKRLLSELEYFTKESISLEKQYLAYKAIDHDHTKQMFTVYQESLKLLPQVNLQIKDAWKVVNELLEQQDGKEDVEESIILEARTQIKKAEEKIKGLEWTTITRKDQKEDDIEEY